MNNIDVSIIVVSYNTRDLTVKCLQSIYEETSNINFEVFVVDNASSDNSGPSIANLFSKVHLLALKRNVGFASANKIAVRYAHGEYLLLLNPDTVILERAIEKLFAFAKQTPHAGIWGGRTLYPDRSFNPTSCYAKMTPWSLFCRAFGFSFLFPNSSLFNPESYRARKYDTIRNVDVITGCFLMINHKLWQQLGGFNPIFFMYGEEVDLCLRAKKIGYQPMFTPVAQIIHYGGASESTQAERISKVFCAKSTLIRLHWPHRSIWFGLGMLLIWASTRAVIMGLLARIIPQKFSLDADKWTRLWAGRRTWYAGFRA